jgi:hypothetical protein
MLGLYGRLRLVMSVDKWLRTKSMKEEVLKAVIEEVIVLGVMG